MLPFPQTALAAGGAIVLDSGARDKLAILYNNKPRIKNQEQGRIGVDGIFAEKSTILLDSINR